MPSRESRVLVVDDDAGVRRSVARSLRSSGYAVELAESAEDALDNLGACAWPPRLVISDIVMPGMSGVALAEHLRNIDAQIPIILITGYAGLHLADHHVEEFEVLEKPFTPDQLLARVAAAIGTAAA
jgi:DNA-binding NtrC family response regulator